MCYITIFKPYESKHQKSVKQIETEANQWIRLLSCECLLPDWLALSPLLTSVCFSDKWAC